MSSMAYCAAISRKLKNKISENLVRKVEKNESTIAFV